MFSICAFGLGLPVVPKPKALARSRPLGSLLTRRWRGWIRTSGPAGFIGAARSGAAIEFAPDSPLEGTGFELPVPRAIRIRFRDFV